MILEAIGQAEEAGTRLAAACSLVGISVRTVERWRQRPEADDDRRGPRHQPRNTLSASEQARIVEVLKSQSM